MNSLGKYVLTKTQKIVLLVVVFALIAGGYYAGFYLPVQRRIEAADHSGRFWGFGWGHC